MDVMIKLHTKMNIDGQEDTVSFTCPGQWSEKENVWYLQYREQDESMGETITIMKIEPQQITLIRRGDVTMRHEYKKGQRTRGTYRGPYGTMLMETDTRSIHFRRRRSADVPSKQQNSHFVAEWEWDYELYLDESRVGTYTMRVELKEVI